MSGDVFFNPYSKKGNKESRIRMEADLPKQGLENAINNSQLV